MRLFGITFSLFTVLICLVLISYAIYVFPIPGTDSIVFIPPALLYSKGFGLANPLYYVTKFTDLTHTNRFNYYVPFYSFLLGILSRIKPGIKTIFFFCALFSSANLLLYTRVISSFLPLRLGLALKITILLSVTYIATYLLPTVGRPENITSLLVFIVYIIYQKRSGINKMQYSAWLMILFALILSSQLICFYFCFLFYILYEIINTGNVYKTITKNILLFLGVLALFCLILQLTPNGLVNTINGIKLHVKYVLNRSDRSFSLFIHYWLLAPLNFGFLIIFLLSGVCFLKEVYAKLKNAATVKIVLASVILLAIVLGIIKFILYAAPTVYSATEFIMPLSAYIIYNIVIAGKSSLRNGFIALSLITYLAGSLVFLRGIILFIDTLQSRKNYAAARPVINRFTEKNSHVYITNGLWSLFDNIDNLTVYDGNNIKSGDTIIIQQANHAFPLPVTEKYTVLYDWRTTEEIKFLGIKIANRPHGYSFVICRIK